VSYWQRKLPLYCLRRRDHRVRVREHPNPKGPWCRHCRGASGQAGHGRSQAGERGALRAAAQYLHGPPQRLDAPGHYQVGETRFCFRFPGFRRICSAHPLYTSACESCASRSPPPPRPPRRHLRFYRLTQVTHMQPSALLFRYLTILQKRLTLPRTALQQYECAHWDKKLMIWGTMAQPGETFSPACRRLAMAMYVHYLSKVQPCCPLLPLLLSYTLQQVTDCRSCNCQRRLGTVSEASRLSGLR